eukprot:CAMPEP_0171321988 /NCGR_PEP_ID=MMETSP0816-20121228/114684_1 /TAXON_ID=420281 /ORGANISM="Proboscia inermis, Strain CCAP1064/1" /LENGTH=527 /DNA_ID=CAMNT_0011820365 /DNA_START=12 /DNA_END=1593 /DNA_ORIENTATION=-
MNDLFDDDGSSSFDVDKETPASKPATNTESAATDVNAPNANATIYDDDDDDAEFGDDDDTKVVGKSLSKSEAARQRKKKQQAPQQMWADDEDDNLTLTQKQQEEAALAKKLKIEAPIPPRRVRVLDIPRVLPKGNPRGGGWGVSAALAAKQESRVTMHMTKLPNILGIQTKPYHSSTYDAGEEEEVYKGYAQNMIRWRYHDQLKNQAQDDSDEEKHNDGLQRDGDGKLLRESNSRVVRWSDGTLSLFIGSEHFEIDELKTHTNGYLYLNQQAKEIVTDETTNQDVETEDPSTVLECMGSIESRLTVSTSLQSDAHKGLTLAVRARNLKKARISVCYTQEDPELEKLNRTKNRELLAKRNSEGVETVELTLAVRARNLKKARISVCYTQEDPELEKLNRTKNRELLAKRNSRGSGGGGGDRAAYKPRSRARNRGYSSEEEDGRYDGTSLNRMKRRTMEEPLDFGDDVDSGDDMEDNWTNRKRDPKNVAAANKRRRRSRQVEDEESESEDEAHFGEESEEEEQTFFKKN